MFHVDLISRGFPEVHIWLVDLEREFKYSNEIFSIEERNRADKFHNEESKNIFLKCRFALRKLLGIYLNIEPSKLSFFFNCYGKPDLSSIQNTLGLAFNLSHTEKLACLAIATHTPVGVDIEKVRPLSTEMEDTTYLFMSDTEINTFRGIDFQKEWAFYHTWTQKEALLKAIGTGLLTDPTTFKAYLTSKPNIRNLPINDWIINSYGFPNHVLSLCTRNEVKPIFHEFTPEYEDFRPPKNGNNVPFVE